MKTLDHTPDAAARIFTITDQEDFARLSGDANPIHVDPVAARRLMFGELVVHGLHLALWGIEQLLLARPGRYRLSRLKMIFSRPVHLSMPVRLTMQGDEVGGFKLRFANDEGELARLSMDLVSDDSGAQAYAGGSPERRARAAAPASFDLSGAVSLAYDRLRATKMFPRCTEALPWRHMAILLASSYIVGMEAPGLHSLFADLDLRFGPEGPEDQLRYSAEQHDDRFGLLTLALDGGGARGSARAFVRPSPVAQASLERLKPMVEPQAFAGQRALIVGASRGLGEVAAKLLVCGGADAYLTYRSGQEDMRQLVAEFEAQGFAVRSGHYDCRAITGDDIDLIRQWKPTHLYYFATPFIKAGQPGQFCDTLFADFAAYYVKGFADTVLALSDHLEAIFYPSSVHVTAPPQNLREYACAKAAGEALCQALAANPARPLRWSAPRLPVLATDQTARIEPASRSDAVTILMPALRNLAEARQP